MGQFNQSLLFPSFQTYLALSPFCSQGAVFWPLGPPRSQGSENSERGDNLITERAFKSYPLTFPFCRCENTGTERQDSAKPNIPVGRSFSIQHHLSSTKETTWALPELFTATSPTVLSISTTSAGPFWLLIRANFQEAYLGQW